MPHESPECLVIDDSRLVRAIVRSILERLGIRVTEAADGEEALRLFRKSSPAMVLVDWNMDGMSGPEVISALRSDPNILQPRILLCSTESRLGMIREALRGGADSYLQKPFDSDRLAHRVRRFGLI